MWRLKVRAFLIAERSSPYLAHGVWWHMLLQSGYLNGSNMRVIKLGIISFIVIFVILYLISLMIPSVVRTSRAINIEAPVNVVYPLLADTSRWGRWNELKNDKIQITQLPSDSNLLKSEWTYGDRTIRSFYRIEKLGDITVV